MLSTVFSYVILNDARGNNSSKGANFTADLITIEILINDYILIAAEEMEKLVSVSNMIETTVPV